MKCDVAVLAIALGCAAFFGEAGHAQEARRPAPADRVYQVFLLGNTGAGAAGSDQLAPTLTLLASQLATAGPNAAVVFLGDLLPCCGMPDSGAVGGGVWYNIVGEVLIRFTVGLSPEDKTYLGGAGFFF